MPELKVSIPQHEEVPKPRKLIGVRHLQFTMMFFTLLIFFIIRTSLSVAIISMTDKTSPDSSVPTYPEWDNVDTILSSFFWGYIVPQVGAGQLSEYFGPKWFLFTTMIIGSIFHIVIPPMAASFGSTGVIICRIIQGLNQGFLYPSTHNLISRWTPLSERSMTANFVYGGSTMGIVIAMFLTGTIVGSKMGWPMSFYLYGGLGIGWAIIFAILVRNSPEEHPWISEEEKMYIQSSNSVTQTAKKVPTPWTSILTSLPVWGILVAGCAQCWGAFTLLTEIPSYMSNIMNYDISKNGQLSALPYIAMFFIGLMSSPIADRIVAKRILSITVTRKIFNSMGSLIPAAALIYLSFVDSSQKTLVTVLLIITVGCTAFVQSGYFVSVIDVAPNHAGTLLGMINGTNNIFSILGPLTVGLLGSDKKDPILWRKVFLVSAGFYICCGIFYDIFVSGEVQSWNDIKNEKCDKEKENKTQIELKL